MTSITMLCWCDIYSINYNVAKVIHKNHSDNVMGQIHGCFTRALLATTLFPPCTEHTSMHTHIYIYSQSHTPHALSFSPSCIIFIIIKNKFVGVLHACFVF